MFCLLLLLSSSPSLFYACFIFKCSLWLFSRLFFPLFISTSIFLDSCDKYMCVQYVFVRIWAKKPCSQTICEDTCFCFPHLSQFLILIDVILEIVIFILKNNGLTFLTGGERWEEGMISGKRSNGRRADWMNKINTCDFIRNIILCDGMKKQTYTHSS